LPSIVVFTLTAVAAGFGVAATGTALGVWAVVGLLCVLAVVLELLVVRSAIALGPALAADADHVWVRVGGFLRPESLRLEWPEIAGFGLRTWQGRRRTSARYLTVRLTESARATVEPELAGAPGRRLRRQEAAFGSLLAITERHKSASLDVTVRGLRDLAPDGVRFTSD
ncbi:hypothetical protein, partial [Actinophytocola sp.]|uniref:hypothetical protein n=1 Tax=Actinophytocola sp. TaxID=1872138 RepID=UPI003D6AB0DA